MLSGFFTAEEKTTITQGDKQSAGALLSASKAGVEAVVASEDESGSIKHAESVAAATDVIGQGFGGFIFRLDADLDVAWDFHPLSLRACGITISETTRTTSALISTITTRAAALTGRAITTRAAALTRRTIAAWWTRITRITTRAAAWSIASGRRAATAITMWTIAITIAARAAIFTFFILTQVRAAGAHA
jgi:hypothetical protein